VLLVVALIAAGASGAVGTAARSAVSVTPLALLPSSVAFWNEDHGLIATGNENYPGSPDQQCRNGICRPGTISVTDDGGRTSRVLVRTPGPATWVGVTGRRQAWAVVHECKRHRCSDLLWHSADAGRDWSRGTLYLTRDGGYRWKAFPKVAEPEADFALSAAVVPGRAFALLSRTPARPVAFRLVATTSGLGAWHTVRTWTSSIR
jgi:hypothetical protein